MQSAPFEIDFSQHIPEIVSLPLEQVARDTLSGEYDDPRLPLVLRCLVQSGYRFSTPEELLALKRIVPGWPYNGFFDLMLAHHLVNFGYSFSMAELQDMGNPADPAGRTVAHYLAHMGRVFSLAELRALGNPPTRDNGWTLAQYMASAGHRFTVAEMNELFLPNQAKQKWDVATAMIDQGYRFSPQEMADLGEAACTAGYLGQTLQEYMDWRTSIVAGWAVASFHLVAAGSAPYFDLKNTHYSLDEKGRGLHIGFGYYAGGDVFCPENTFVLALEESGMGWEVQIRTLHAYNPYDYTLQQIALADLAAKIRQALQDQRDLDFTDYDLRFNDHCGYGSCEMDIPIALRIQDETG